jgi:RNA polymerase sigma-70 factor (ECF subfamily)
MDEDASNLHDLLAAPTLSPEKIFHRNWALHILERALKHVEAAYGNDGKEELFHVLKPVLTTEADALDRESACARLGVQPSHLRVMIHRLRRDFRKALRDEVLETILDPADVEDEIRQLALAVSGEW